MNRNTNGSPVKKDLFQQWKEYEKQRRVGFAAVMKERRRLKALSEPNANGNGEASPSKVLKTSPSKSVLNAGQLSPEA
jgi:hypothetical protein